MKLVRSEAGGAAVEFAFLAPILAMLVGGIIEVGNLTQVGMLASNAAREGARYAAVSDAADVKPAVANYLANALAGRAGGNVTVGSVTLNGVDLDTSSPPALTPGTTATVSVPVTVTLGMPIVQNMLGGQGSIVLTGSSAMEVYAKPS